MIQLVITKTSKSYSPSDIYRVFHEDIKTFNSISDAKQWLKNEYGTCKRSKMYIDDDNNGKTHHVGYIYHFRNEDVSHYENEKWLQQDWIEFRSVKTIHFN